jgi:hypothetical protein
MNLITRSLLVAMVMGGFSLAQAQNETLIIKPGKYSNSHLYGLLSCSVFVEPSIQTSAGQVQWIEFVDNTPGLTKKVRIRHFMSLFSFPHFKLHTGDKSLLFKSAIFSANDIMTATFQSGGKLHPDFESITKLEVNLQNNELVSYFEFLKQTGGDIKSPRSFIKLKSTIMNSNCQNLKLVN